MFPSGKHEQATYVWSLTERWTHIQPPLSFQTATDGDLCTSLNLRCDGGLRRTQKTFVGETRADSAEAVRRVMRENSG